MMQMIAKMVGMGPTSEEKRADKLRVPEPDAIVESKECSWLIHVAPTSEWVATQGQYKPSAKRFVVMTCAGAAKSLQETLFVPSVVKQHRSIHIDTDGEWTKGYDQLTEESFTLVCVPRSDVQVNTDVTGEMSIVGYIDKQRKGYAEFEVICRTAVPDARAECSFTYYVQIPSHVEMASEYEKTRKQLGIATTTDPFETVECLE